MGMSENSSPVVVFCALLFFPVAANGEEDAAKPRIAIGPVAGSCSEYEVILTMRSGGGEQKQALAVTAYRLPGKEQKEALLVIRQMGPGLVGPQMPLTFLEIGGNGRADLRTGSLRMSMIGPALAETLFTAMESSSLEPGTRWSGREELSMLPMGAVELVHHAEKSVATPAHIRIRSELSDKKAEVPTVGLMVKSWKRLLEVDKDTLRPVSARIELALEFRRGFVQSQEMNVEVIETKHVLLSEQALASLPHEIAALKRAQEAAENQLVQLFQSGRAVISSSVDGKIITREATLEDKKLGDPDKLLSAYEKEFPDGVLAFVVKPMRDALAQQIQLLQSQLAGDKRGRELVNKPAPDFTLKDLEGKDVSLRDFRGKTVLLSFWGYG